MVCCSSDIPVGVRRQVSRANRQIMAEDAGDEGGSFSVEQDAGTFDEPVAPHHSQDVERGRNRWAGCVSESWGDDEARLTPADKPIA
jgi:hypothetical protein